MSALGSPFSTQFLADDADDLDNAIDFDIDFDEDYENISDAEFDVFLEYSEEEEDFYNSEVADGEFSCLDNEIDVFEDFDLPENTLTDTDYVDAE